MKNKAFVCVLGATLLAGRAAIAQPSVCAIQGERPMAVAQLFFGRAIEGRGILTEDEWTRFVTNELSRDFPDGFTVYDGQGQWRDPATGKVVREPSKIVIVAAEENAAFSRHVLMAVEAYRKWFKQKSVGVITSTACAEF